MKRVQFVVVLVTLVFLLSCIPAAMATDGKCKEYVNPHGKVIPPAGSTTAPGLNPNSGINPDGFYNLSMSLGNVDPANVYFIIWDLGADSKLGGEGKDTDVIIGEVPYQTHVVYIEDKIEWFYLNIKYTEANGAEPSFKEMATSGKDNNGQSKAVAYHFKGTGDFAYQVRYGTADDAITDPVLGCLVPPPPKDEADFPVV